MFLKTEFWRIKKNCHQFLGFIRESVLKPPSALPYNFTVEDVRWVKLMHVLLKVQVFFI
jgi:hypothetical protein